MAEAVGLAFLSATLQVLLDRMASRNFLNIFRHDKLFNASLKKLNRKLLALNAVLSDAEKQIKDPAVRAWLSELQHAVYDAEDLLDEIATDASRCKLEAETSSPAKRLWGFNISIPSVSNPFIEGINSKMEELIERLEDFAKDKDVLGLKEGGGKLPQRLPTTHLVDEECVYGRNKDKESIMKLLLSDNDSSGHEQISVVTIVGMGGVGKTTLAQLVYSDARVEKRFDLKIWVCVSIEFDVCKMTKTMVEAVISQTCDITDLDRLHITDLDRLQGMLKEKLVGKKTLLVLDDVWSENFCYWDVLRAPFKGWAKESRIIVTTRNERVASFMRTVPTYYLEQLSYEDCWSLFSKHAFRSGSSRAHTDLEIIGKKIVKKCSGLPLAAKTLGGLLHSISDAEEWTHILNSEIWDLPDDGSSIFPALRLSYHYLPVYLKRCFAYCSIFPKDYEFEKQQIVLLWMAEGFVHSPNCCTKGMEKIGDEYFCELLSRSIFQKSSRNKSCFVMHDLLHDLAQFASGEFCFRLQDGKLHAFSEKTCHLSYPMSKYDTFKKFKAWYGFKGLRTFLPLQSSVSNTTQFFLTKEISHGLLPTLRCLRVLSLSDYKNIIELPDKIGDLRHLRYLDLSNSGIQRLPNSICALHNLQTLQLFQCRSLTKLPASMTMLINLRHLNIHGTNLKEMPEGMSRLTSLRTLSNFFVAEPNGSRIRELGELHCLQGTLSILGLENVVGEDAMRANLKGKVHLDELLLGWRIGTNDSKNEREVLEKLQPHKNLKRISIGPYSGTRFPKWLGDPSFSNMVFLCLSECYGCGCLPSLGQLPSLKELCISRCGEVWKVTSEFYSDGSSCCKPFRSLETLKFENLPKWEEWHCMGIEDGGFPCLRELYIESCPLLTGSFPNHLPSLVVLRISGCKQLVASLPKLPSIQDLSLDDCGGSVLTNLVHFSSLTSLRISKISRTSLLIDEGEMTNLPMLIGLKHLSSLVALEMDDFQYLKELPEKLHNLTSLKRLTIRGCTGVFSFHEIGLPPMLKQLSIEGCTESVSLLDQMEPDETWQRTLYSRPGNVGQDNQKISSCCLKYLPCGLPSTLTTLTLENCGGLELVPSKTEEIGTAFRDYKFLESISIDGSSSSVDSLPFNIFSKVQNLSISNCKNLKALSIVGGLPSENFISLHQLTIWRCPNLKSFPDGLPLPSLASFSISVCKNLFVLPEMESSLTSLRELKILDCPQLISFQEGRLPSGLEDIQISYSDKFMAHRCDWGLQRLTSLAHFEFCGSQIVKSFPEEGLLPPTLTSLGICSLPELEKLNNKGLRHLTSLQKLSIKNCSKLTCIPEQGMPTSLSLLIIEDCPSLKQPYEHLADIACIHLGDRVNI